MMKKLVITTIILFMTVFTTNAQIPNSGFESWSSWGSGMTPDGWWCSNDSIDPGAAYFPITRSDDHFPSGLGSYSLRIESNAAFSEWTAYGMAWPGGYYGSDFPTFAVSGHPKALCGYYKFLPESGDKMNIEWFLYKNGSVIAGGDGIFQSGDTVSEWTPFKIYVSDTNYLSADSARIMISSFVNMVRGNSVLFVDNLSFDTHLTSVPNLTGGNSGLLFYPNPATDLVTVKTDRQLYPDLTLNIYAASGALAKTVILDQGRQQFSTSDLGSGIYLVEILSKEGSDKQKLLIKR
jgi:hypothetical protein